MKASIEEMSPVQKRLSIEITSETVNDTFGKVLGDIRKKAKIHGFRPGKAPLNLIKRLYADSATEEVQKKLIQENLFQALEEQKLEPVDYPFIEKFDPPTIDSKFAFSAVVDILPTIEIGDAYKNIEVECKKYSYTQKDVDQELRRLQLKQAKSQPVDKDLAAQTGHQVTISLFATVDGKEISQLEKEKSSFILGENQLHPEIEQEIIGMKAESDKNVELKLTQEQEPAKLRVIVHKIDSLSLPQLDDEFAKDLEHDSLASLQDKINLELQNRCEQKNKWELEKVVLDELKKKVPFAVPPAIIDRVINSIIEDEFSINDPKQKQRAIEDQQLRQSLKPQAQEKAQSSMLLQQIIEKEQLKVDNQQLHEHIRKVLGDQVKDAKEIDALIAKNGPRMKESLLFANALQKLISLSQIKEIPTQLFSTSS